MDCPVCKNAMVVLELEDVEIDHCYDCGGIWLDAGELELLVEDRGKAEQLLNSFKVENNPKEALRKCPICLKKMKKIIVGEGAPLLLIDKCAKGHGLWLDAGELQDVLNRAQLGPDSKIQKLLADMFGTEGVTES